MATFKILPACHGSGWVGLHIAVDQYVQSGSLVGSGEICLSAEAITAEEFDSYVDELIQKLNDLKPIARRKLQKVDREL